MNPNAPFRYAFARSFMGIALALSQTPMNESLRAYLHAGVSLVFRNIRPLSGCQFSFGTKCFVLRECACRDFVD